MFTKRLTSMSQKLEVDDPTAVAVNIMSNSSPWRKLSPYHMKTDGVEEQRNPGGVLFENFWQGSKVYPEVFPIEVYSHYRHTGNPAQLHWAWDRRQTHYSKSTGEVDLALWHSWRDSLWAAPKAVRYPNGYARRGLCVFALLNDSERLPYIESRKRIYVQEYVRLAKQTDEFARLLALLRAGKAVCLGEIDVPAPGKRGTHNSEAAEVQMTLPYLDAMLHDDSEPFGHGLCLALALLQELAAKRTDDADS